MSISHSRIVGIARGRICWEVVAAVIVVVVVVVVVVAVVVVVVAVVYLGSAQAALLPCTLREGSSVE